MIRIREKGGKKDPTKIPAKVLTNDDFFSGLYTAFERISRCLNFGVISRSIDIPVAMHVYDFSE